jgi:hypothetical protein
MVVSESGSIAVSGSMIHGSGNGELMSTWGSGLLSIRFGANLNFDDEGNCTAVGKHGVGSGRYVERLGR